MAASAVARRPDGPALLLVTDPMPR